MKKIGKALFFALISVLAVFACACTPRRSNDPSGGVDGYTLTFELFDGDNYTVSGVKTDGKVTSMTVPKLHEGKPVTRLGNYAFENCAGVKEINLPDGITEIGQGAFKNCTALESIVIPDSVMTMYSETFSGCTALKSIQLSDSLGALADCFDGCTALESIEIPASVTAIYGNPFKSCDSLASVTADARNQNFTCRDGVVYGNYQTEIVLAIPSVTSVDVPDTVTSIGEQAFSNCKKLTSIRLPDSVQNVGHGAFENCTSLGSVYFPKDIRSFSQDVFSGCRSIIEAEAPLHVVSILPANSLKRLNITDGQYIADSQFKSYTALEEVAISGVGNIGQYAFYDLRKLKRVTLSRDVTDIGKNAFSFCNGLTEVRYGGSVADWCKIAFADAYANPLSLAHKLYVDGALVTELSVPDVTEIEQYAFYGCDSLTKVALPSGLVGVGKDAFSLCERLTEVSYAGSLADWCKISFYNAQSNPLTYAHDLYIGGELVTELSAENVGEVKRYAFSGCTGLAKVDLSTVRTVGLGAFSGCDNIAEAIAPAYLFYNIPKTGLNTATVTSGAISNNAFKDCALESVTLLDGVTGIGDQAFSGCSAIEQVSVPASVVSIGNLAFYNCTSLGSAEILGAIDTIRSNTFSGCTALNEFAIPASVTKIERGAFYGCKGLASIDISGAVSEIEQGAFALCENLQRLTVAPDNMHYSAVGGALYDKNQTTIYFVPTAISGEISLADTLSTVGEYAFAGCDKLTGVTIPSGVTAIGRYAFSDCTGLNSISIAAVDCTVGENAFLNADNITEAVLPAVAIPYIPKTALNSVTVTGGAIGENAFSGCAALGDVTLSDTVTTIGAGAFKNTGITSIEIPDTVISVGADAFGGCAITEATLKAELISGISKTALNSVTVTGGVIGENAFSGCRALETVTLSATVTAIGSGAFKNTGITSIEIPDTVISVGADAFGGCAITEATLKAEFIPSISKTALNSVTVTGGAIGENAFSGCRALEQVALSNTVTEIGDGAFNGCSALTGLSIPSSVTSIGQRVFVGCAAMSGVTAENNAVFYVDNGILIKRDGDFRDVMFAPVSISGKVAFSTSIRDIVGGAFYGCDKITGVDAAAVSRIADDAFYGCDNITELKVAAAHISKFNKAKLQKAEIVSGAVAANAFGGCAALSDITLSHYVSAIGRGAFSGTAYYSDESNWTGGVLYIDKCLIVARPSLSGTHTVRSDTELIADGAFDGCSGLTGIDIPGAVTKLGSGVFDGCGNIAYAKLPLKVISTIPKNSLRTVEIFGSGGIADNAFDGLSALSSLKIADGITAIGDEAFKNCSALAAVDIADSVSRIGEDAFSGTAYINNDENYDNGVLYIAKSLVAAKPTLLVGEYSVRTDTVQIAVGAFDGCIHLTGVSIPESVESIGARAFDGCSGLNTVTVSADNNAYSSFGGLLYNKAQDALVFVPVSVFGEVSLPDTLASIQGGAFKNCVNVTAVRIPDSVTSIGDNAFYGCSALKTLHVPSGVQTLGSGVFDGCTNIENAVMPAHFFSLIDRSKLKTVTVTGGAIADECFKDCTAVTGVTVSSGVTSIGAYAFSGCTGLTEIVIPTTVTSIGDRAFYDCRIKSATLSAEHISAIPTAHLTAVTVLGGAIESYAFRYYSRLSTVTLCEGVTDIGTLAFSGLSEITSVAVPGTVTSIGDSAFYNCANLSSVTLNEGVGSIGEQAFAMTKIATVQLPATLTTIGQDAFFDCVQMESVTVADGNNNFVCVGGVLYDKTKIRAIYAPTKLAGEVTMPNTVKYISENAFYGCADITGVIMPSSVTNIYGGAFYGCDKLRSIKIPVAGYVSVASDAFSECPSIVDVYAPVGVLSGAGLNRSDLTKVTVSGGEIRSDLFNGCTKLTEVTLLSGVTGMGDNAFKGCSGITGIVIPDSVTSIGNSAFYGCTALISADIPDYVTSIGNYAFYGCVALTSADIPDRVTSIGSSAFSGCALLSSAIIPSGVTSIGSGAFSGCSGLTEVNVPRTATLGSGVFNGCGNVEIANIPASVALDISNDKLTTLTVSIGVIPDSAFSGRKLLTSLTIGEGVTAIGVGAFRGCDALDSITVASGNKNIKFDELSGILYTTSKTTSRACFAIKKDVSVLTVPDGILSIEPYLFDGRTTVTQIYLPSSLSGIGEYAFRNCTGITLVRYEGSVFTWADLVGRDEIKDNCFDGAPVHYIVCKDNRQYNWDTKTVVST